MAELKGKQAFVPDPGSLHVGKFRHFKSQVSGGVARFTLDRPEHNLLNEAVLRELTEGIAQAGQDNEARVLVLDAAGKVFSGGVDVAEYTSDRAFQVVDAFQTVFSAILDVNKPVIAVVNGPAIGGGAELVAFCDLIIASPKARFALPEVTIGVFPPLAATILPHLVGPKMAMELILTGEPVSAERALDLGMVNRLVPENQLEPTLAELAARIGNCSRPVLAMAKRAILGGMGLSLREAMKNSLNIFLNELYRLEDSQEGLRALVERRKPAWRNR